MSEFFTPQLDVSNDYFEEVHVPYLLITDAQRTVQNTTYGAQRTFELGTTGVPPTVEKIAAFITTALQQPFNTAVWRGGSTESASFSEVYRPQQYAGKIVRLALMDSAILQTANGPSDKQGYRLIPGRAIVLSAAEQHWLDYARSSKFRRTMLLGFDPSKSAT
jgi:hypothetical protein